MNRRASSHGSPVLRHAGQRGLNPPYQCRDQRVTVLSAQDPAALGTLAPGRLASRVAAPSNDSRFVVALPAGI